MSSNRRESLFYQKTGSQAVIGKTNDENKTCVWTLTAMLEPHATKELQPVWQQGTRQECQQSEG